MVAGRERRAEYNVRSTDCHWDPKTGDIICVLLQGNWSDLDLLPRDLGAGHFTDW